MKGLKCVTLTGADSSTSIPELFALGFQYPFLEFGILYHGKKEGSGRYPSIGWIRDMIAYSVDHPSAKFSLHLCGESANRAFVNGVGFFSQSTERFETVFRRVQMNVNMEVGLFTPKDISLACERHPNQYVITQHNAANKQLFQLVSARNHQILFDESGGRGVMPGSWPMHQYKRDCGYAGGLGPHNIEAELPKIYKAAGAAPFWIDMEGCLRTTDNRFEITAAKHVAVIVNRYLLGSMRFGWDS